MSDATSRRIVCFGDSLTVRYAPVFESAYRGRFPDLSAEVVQAGISGETTADGLKRLPELLGYNPTDIAICFGMNDWGKQGSRLPVSEYAKNLSGIVGACEAHGMRVLILTPNPVAGEPDSHANRSLGQYVETARSVAREKRVRLVDVHKAWREVFRPSSRGLEDNLHPNRRGRELYARKLADVIERRSQIILWQYNGNPCQCNYHCPYCQYPANEQKGHFYEGPIERWHGAFRQVFGNRHLVFYFGHGEPMVGKGWWDVVRMVESEPNWEMRVTTNLSVKLDRLLSSRLVFENRLNINASFHPTETTIEKFLRQLEQCREAGIEVPVVYTMYPPFFERFEDDFREFDKRGVLVHVRRFRGTYKSTRYPEGYSDAQLRYIAQFCDDATIKYMLSDSPTDGNLSWTGCDFCLVDAKGEVGYCDDYRTKRHSFGNVFSGDVSLNDEAAIFPDGNVSDGTVDGVANICELDYPQLQGNNIFHFSRLGGVCRNGGTVCYKHRNTDFTDSRVRARYRFPARNLKDALAIITNRDVPWETRVWELLRSINPAVYNYRFARPSPGQWKKIPIECRNFLARLCR